MNELDDIEARFKALVGRRDKVSKDKMKVEAELTARKRALKDAMDECRRLGHNPDTLADDIKKMREVLVVKLNVFEADLKTAEEAIKPMMKEVG